ncbi:MAG: DUF2079 domain-containing protein, partial [Chloroflexi bacterium]|nr:DUF2079 domain-containing protein [Chloroflexota bacterium]
ALQGAALSDFHLVAVAAALLMLALYLLESGRPTLGAVCLAIVALCREDAALAVAWLSLLLAVRPGIIPALRATSPRARWLFCATGVLWTGACFLLIAPYFNGQGSVFWARYAWLGPTPLQAAAGVARDPGPLLAWFTQKPVWQYLAVQLLSSGFLALLAPAQLLATLPLLAVNALSSFDWMRSGGGHYSALQAPLLLWAGAHGARRCIAVVRRFAPAAHQGMIPVLGCVLVSAAAAQAWIGVHPGQPGLSWLPQDPRAARVLAELASVPSVAVLTASSGLYPHASNRRWAYWFPGSAPNAWVAVDVAGETHPLDASATRAAFGDLLASGRYRVAAATAGLLILAPLQNGSLPLGVADLPPSFFDFTQLPALPTSARLLGPVGFGPSLQLLGYQLQRWPAAGLLGDEGELLSYWSMSGPLTADLHFALATTARADGALSGVHPDAAAAPLWYPTSSWRPGYVYQLSMTVNNLALVRALGVQVIDGAGRALPVDGPVDIWQGGTIARIVNVS